MKTLYTAALLALCSASVHAFEPAQITGQWQCQGSDEMVRFSGTTDYRADGTLHTVVDMNIEDDGKTLSYHVEANGTWQLKGQRIEDTSQATLLERRHSADTQAWLAESEDAQLLESLTYSGLEAWLAEPKTDSVGIKSLSPNTLLLEDDTFQAECTRLK